MCNALDGLEMGSYLEIKMLLISRKKPKLSFYNFPAKNFDELLT